MADTGLTIDPDSEAQLLRAVAEHPYVALVGGNNCGKTWLLKHLAKKRSDKSHLLGAFHAPTLTLGQPQDLDGYNKTLLGQWRNFEGEEVSRNTDECQTNRSADLLLKRITDNQRRHIFEDAGELLGQRVTVGHEDPENTDCSASFISVDGAKFQFASTGTRSLITILACLRDSTRPNLFLDEPETSLAPPLARRLAQHLMETAGQDGNARVVFATHSHLFVPLVPAATWKVRKVGNKITCAPVASDAEQRQLVFTLMGGAGESFFFPDLVCFVEGQHDEAFLSAVLAKKFPDMRCVVIRTDGDGNMRRQVGLLKRLLRSDVFWPRVFVIVDARNQAQLRATEYADIPEANRIVWGENGIEYQYPKQLVAEIEGIKLAEVDDRITAKLGDSEWKRRLNREVVSRIDGASEYPEQLGNLLHRIGTALDMNLDPLAPTGMAL